MNSNLWILLFKAEVRRLRADTVYDALQKYHILNTQYTADKNGTVFGRKKSKSKRKSDNVTEDDIDALNDNNMAAYMIDFIKREDDINDDYYDDEERPRDLLASVEIEEVVDGI